VPEKIIDVALVVVKDSTRQAAEYLRRIKQESEEAENLRFALEEERAAVAEKFASLDRSAAQQERERERIFQEKLGATVSDFENRARQLVATIQDRSERLKVEREAQRRVSELKREAQRATNAGGNREAASAAPVSTSGRGVRVMRDGLVVKKEKESQTAEPEYAPAAHTEISVGDKVKLRSFGSIGIVDSIKGGEAQVRVKSVHLREKLENLERVELTPNPKSKTEKFSTLREAKSTEIHLKPSPESGRVELNLIGRTTDEAVAAVDKFLDEASLASLSQVRIIHGHGTGALRRVITEMLKGHPHVARFVAAPQDQGGTGATLVELRQ